MTEDEQEYHIYRIISGYTIIEVDGITYVVDTPTPKIINEANFYYQKALSDIKYTPMLDDDMAKIVLIKHNFWTLQGDSNLAEIEKSLDNAKMALYHAFFLTEKAVNDARKTVKLVREKRNEQINKRHSLDQNTNKGLAISIKDDYILSCIIKNKDYEPVKIEDGFLLKKIRAEIESQALSHTDYRLLARNETWKSLWSALGTDAFRTIGTEQLWLLNYTKMYENAVKYPDPPPKEVIADDDMFDGWMLSMSDGADSQKSMQNYYANKYKNANEIFIFAKDETQEGTKANINKVLSMNDTAAQVTQAQLHKLVKEKESITDLDIPQKVLDLKGNR